MLFRSRRMLDLPVRNGAEAVRMIGTKAMLVSRDGLSPPIVNLLLDAAREVHGAQGYFEANGEFPNTTQVDLPENTRSGLVDATEKLRGIKGIGLVELERSDIVRHRLVQNIVNAYERQHS